MANKMLIDATHPEETRVVVLRGNRVEEFDFETAHRKQLRGNIYLAKVTRVEPSLQAAFVDYGGNRHGFLAFSEIHPDYYQIPVADRQALIEADARDARERDSEDDHSGGRRRHRGRRGEQHASRRDESVQSDPLPVEAAVYEATEQPTGEPTIDDLPPSAEIGEPPEAPESAPFAEAENPPVAAEIATPLEQQQPEPQPGAPAAELGETPFEAAPAGEPEAAPSGEPVAAIEDAAMAVAAPEPDGNGQNGHGAEEEEEAVESVGGSDALEEAADRAPRFRRQYKIQEVIKRRQVLLVQVVKEERGTKGAALTTYLSLAGRYCVLMPNTARGGGISRKITSAEDRKKLREIAEELAVPDGMGVILRTAGAARTKAEVKRDFEYLLRTWEQVRDLTLRSTAPTLVYEEGSLAKRSIRDLYTKDIDEVIVAGDSGYRDSKEFMRMLMPSHAKNVKLYNDTQPIFTRYGIESQLDAMFSPTVQLRSGGYVVLNQTEALVSIDVNSGRSTREHHIEDTALKTNVEAAEEIARQLRLRDLAGLIVIDFIDMDEKRNNRTVERRLKDALRHDRARIQVGRISHFGLMEMSRQRIRTSVLESSTEKCVHCGGTGHVRSVSSVALQLLRSLEEMLLKGPTHNLIVRTRPDIALYVLNHKRAHLQGLEQRFRVALTVNADEAVGGQTGFVIDRGEQVMSVEQAKALVAQAETAPALIEEAEPELTEAADELEAADAEDRVPSTGDDAPETAPGEPDHERSEIGRDDSDRGRDEFARDDMGRDDMGRDDMGRDGGGRGRRRRRRRGRGGRGGEERGRGPQPQQYGAEPQPFEHDNGGAERSSEFAPGGNGDVAPGEHAPPQGRSQRDHGDNGGNGEHRRRRRGRRGGRRNRRDREGQNLDFAAAPGQDPGGPESYDRPAHNDASPWTARTEQPATDFVDRAPAVEPAPQPAPVPQPAEAAPPPAPAEPSRRRSTVREPAPMFSGSSSMDAPMPTPQPAPTPPPAATASEAEDTAKPRRTGWWAKRLLGGDKG
jgi:ribonuclease E